MMVEEPLAGMAAELPGEDHPAQQRRRPVALLAQLIAQPVEHGEDVVEADRIGPGERPARVVEAVDHPGVDVLGAADALGERERRLVDDLADDAAEDEAGAVLYPGGVLAERREEPLRRYRGRLG